MKTVVVTGANRGIGLGFAKYYAKNGFKVFALCRKASDELKNLNLNLNLNLNVNVIENFDLSSSVGDIRQLLGDIAQIDILINNAAQWGDEKLGQINYQNILDNINLNALGSLKVTETFLDRLQVGSKIIFMTSRMGSISDNGSGGRYAYRMSKAALNSAAKSVSIDLKAKGIPVGIIHPGWVQTEMGGPRALMSVDKAVRDINTILENLNIENTGTFWHSSG
ncbi:SDR family oxidoreductase, partial [Francisellaceae bacterium]|nr:SDR family oxidoreductase [Francisellaceae bacterium]